MKVSVLEQDQVSILKKVYEEHRRIIVAFDFDNTVFDYHNVGLDCSPIVDILHECQSLGFPLICFTSNVGDRLVFIKHYLKEVLRFKKSIVINGDVIALHVSSKVSNYTKPYANIYLDDKAGLKESYNNLKEIIKYTSEVK